jgi:hypothetical protein
MYNLVQTGHTRKKQTGYAKKYFKKQVKVIHEILHRQPLGLAEDKIHELRMEIKKTKALFTMITYANSKFSKRKYFKPFRKLFDASGEVRCVQVEQELLKKYITDEQDKYIDHLRHEEIEKSKELEELIQSKIISKLKGKNKKILPFIDAVAEKDIKTFLKKDAKKLSSLTERKIFRERDLHVIRKRLKNFYFIAKSAYSHIVTPDPWNKLLELLGHWHDSQVSIEHLRKAIYVSSYHQSEIDRLYAVKQELIVAREKIFDQISSTYSLIQSKENRIKLPRNVPA